MTHPGAQYLAELEASAKKATQGEWTAEKRHESCRHILAEVHGLVIAADNVGPSHDTANAAHIANASPARIAAIVEAFAAEKARADAAERLVTLGSVTELAAENPNVMSYVEHWEGRGVGIDWSKGKKAPRTFELMKQRGF